MNAAPKTILISRTVSAPIERVFQAFLDPADLLHWHHATDGWTTPHAVTDPVAGGAFNIGFRSPDGSQGFEFGGTYDEIDPPKRIVYTIGDGRKVWIDFKPVGDKTQVDLTLTLEDVHGETQQRDGWTGMLENLDRYLASL